MLERTPRKYRHRTPDLNGASVIVDLASGDRVELAKRLAAVLDLALSATKGLSSADFLALVAERMVDVLGLVDVKVWAFPYDGVDSDTYYSYRGWARDQAETLLVNSELRTFAIGADSCVLVDGPSQDGYPPLDGAVDGEANGGPVLVIPLRIGAVVLGLMVASRPPAMNGVSPDWLVLARALCSFMALELGRNRPLPLASPAVR